MKMKFKCATAILLAAFSMLSSCAVAPMDEITSPAVTEELFPDESSTSEPLSAEDIIYEKEELPAVYITTEDNFQVTSKKEYTACGVRFELSDRFAEYESTYTDENGGGAQLRCRGNASYNNPEMKTKNKYSYKLKLDTKADLFGFGESKHWYLINNWRDISAMRHKLAYDLALTLGITSVDSTWVSLYYNGEYRGLYLLTESVSIGESRVDITDWEEFAEDVADAYAEDNALTPEETAVLSESMETNLAWISTAKHTFGTGENAKELDLSPYFDPDSLDLTSGYLIEFCTGFDTSGTKWKTKNNQPVVMDSPFYLQTNKEMYDFVRTLVQDFEDAVTSPTFHNSKGKHYSEYVDVDSMIDYWIIWNLFRNTEFGARSMYYHIENGKIIFGPIWDFDATIGNIITLGKASTVYGSWVRDRSNQWYTKVFSDPWFTAKCQERWFDIKEALDDTVASMDIYYNYIYEENLRCLDRNGIRTYSVKTPEANGGKSFTPEQDQEYMLDWMDNRISWINEQLSVVSPKIDIGGIVRSDEMFVTAALNGKELEKDTITVYGAPADYVIPANAAGSLDITATTSYGSSVKVFAFLNGSEQLGERPYHRGDKAQYTIDLFALDLTPGAINVVFFIAYRNDGSIRGVTSTVIRVADIETPKEGEYIIDVHGEKTLLKKGEEFTLPDVSKVHDGYFFCGWTLDGNKTYAPGTVIVVENDLYFYPKWKRLDVFSRMLVTP